MVIGTVKIHAFKYNFIIRCGLNGISTINHIPKNKKSLAALDKSGTVGFGRFSGAGFRLPSGELLRRHAPMKLNLVCCVFSEINPVDRPGDYRVFDFAAGMVKADSPGQHVTPSCGISCPAEKVFILKQRETVGSHSTVTTGPDGVK